MALQLGDTAPDFIQDSTEGAGHDLLYRRRRVAEAPLSRADPVTQLGVLGHRRVAAEHAEADETIGIQHRERLALPTGAQALSSREKSEDIPVVGGERGQVRRVPAAERNEPHHRPHLDIPDGVVEHKYLSRSTIGGTHDATTRRYRAGFHR